MTIWNYLILGYVTLAVLSFSPTLVAMAKGTKLHPGGESFDNCSHFTEPAKQRLKAHYTRIAGTLSFWKSEASKNARFHYYCLWWSIISSVAMPFLTQAIDPTAPAAKWLLTTISAHIALILAFHKGLRVAENYRAFRHGESEFYDLYRLMLDQPKKVGATEDEQLENYFNEVASLRRLIRNAETDNLPTLEDVKKPKDAG